MPVQPERRFRSREDMGAVTDERINANRRNADRQGFDRLTMGTPLGSGGSVGGDEPSVSTDPETTGVWLNKQIACADNSKTSWQVGTPGSVAYMKIFGHVTRGEEIAEFEISMFQKNWAIASASNSSSLFTVSSKDLTDFFDNANSRTAIKFWVDGSASNDAQYTLSSSALNGSDTEITTTAAPSDSGADGRIYLVATKFAVNEIIYGACPLIKDGITFDVEVSGGYVALTVSLDNSSQAATVNLTALIKPEA